MNASAISMTTSVFLSRRRVASPDEPRPPSFIVLARLGRVTCMAGTRPNTTPVRTEMASENRSTRRSMATCASRGSMKGGRSAWRPVIIP